MKQHLKKDVILELGMHWLLLLCMMDVLIFCPIESPNICTSHVLAKIVFLLYKVEVIALWDLFLCHYQVSKSCSNSKKELQKKKQTQKMQIKILRNENCFFPIP